MNALQICLASATQQFIGCINHNLLAEAPKKIVSASLLTVAALAAPTVVQAQPDTGISSVFPQRSAARWGEFLGGSVGRALGASAIEGINPPNSQVGRVFQNAISGISEEVGGNIGRSAAQRPYQSSQLTQFNRQERALPVSQPAPVYAPRVPYSVPIVLTNSSSSLKNKFVLSYYKDNLDILAIKAILAHNEYVKEIDAGGINAEFLNEKKLNSISSFEIGLRSAFDQGFNVQPWIATRAALQQPLGNVSESDFLNLGAPMVERLNRQNGPGSAALDQDRQLFVIQREYRDYQQSQKTRSMPIEQFGR